MALVGNVYTVKSEDCDGENELEESDNAVDDEAYEAAVGGGAVFVPDHCVRGGEGCGGCGFGGGRFRCKV